MQSGEERFLYLVKAVERVRFLRRYAQWCGALALAYFFACIEAVMRSEQSELEAEFEIDWRKEIGGILAA